MRGLIIIIMISTIFLLGCKSDVITLPSSNIVTTPNSSVDVSKSFELQSFCDSTSIVSNNSLSLTCSSGLITDLKFINGNWSGLCCNYKSTKCFESNVSDILSYNGLNMSAEHILSSDYYQGGFFVTCCNSGGTMCYTPKMINYTGCGNGYSEMVSHLDFNSSGFNNWRVISCLNGFN